MPQLWTTTHAPAKLDDIVGNAECITAIRTWALDWQRGKRQKPLLLHGPPGCGKTAAARALATEMGWVLLETNASDLRDGENVKKIVGLASATGTLFGEKRLVLFDEVDGAFDRGEVPALMKILTDALQPIVLTANDVWEPKLGPLRASAIRVEFKKVAKYDVKKALQRIAEKENRTMEDLTPYLDSANGDVRSAIIDFQSGHPSERQREQNVFDGIRRLFKAKNFQEALGAQDDSAIDFDLFFRWIEENIPIEYETAEDLARAFDALSRSSVFGARIRRRQDWDLLKFQRAMALAGVGCAKVEIYRKFTPYRFPDYVRKLSASQRNRAALKTASLKVGQKLGCSVRKAKEDMPYYRAFAEYFEWDEDEKVAAGVEIEKNPKARKSVKAEAASSTGPSQTMTTATKTEASKGTATKKATPKKAEPTQSKLF
ncbi:replication factor C large subunit [Candidatus Micrarchaeota archaeon]|nr:replication factor C large subunit [Candidatus Micrarchaeota archaeon]